MNDNPSHNFGQIIEFNLNYSNLNTFEKSSFKINSNEILLIQGNNEILNISLEDSLKILVLQ